MPGFFVAVRDPRGAAENVGLRAVPDECPQCHQGIDARFVTGFIPDDVEIGGHTHLQIVFQCPRRECHRLFIAHYTGSRSAHSSDGIYILSFLAPNEPQTVDFPEPIENISPMFCQIYNEAAHAETLNLLNIAGPGYRKALEFLVKDFLIAEEPDKAEAIKKMELGNALANKVSDANIKKCAQRAAWLGNDETHYERRWNNHDLGDLKRLVKLTVNWTESTLLTRDYEQEMPAASTRATTG